MGDSDADCCFAFDDVCERQQRLFNFYVIQNGGLFFQFLRTISRISRERLEPLVSREFEFPALHRYKSTEIECPPVNTHHFGPTSTFSNEVKRSQELGDFVLLLSVAVKDLKLSGEEYARSSSDRTCFY